MIEIVGIVTRSLRLPVLALPQTETLPMTLISGRETVSYDMMRQIKTKIGWSVVIAIACVSAAVAVACNSNETLLSQKPTPTPADNARRSEEHTSELQSPYVISYAV